MKTRIALVAAALTVSAVSAPVAAQCGGARCAARGAVKGSSVVPPPDEFNLRGDRFTSQFTDVPLAANGSRSYDLGFSVNFGFGLVSSINVHENGFVSFAAPAVRTLQSLGTTATAAAPAPAQFLPVSDLRRLGVPVIAPFYADLVQGSGAGDTRLTPGDVVVQYGTADPYADGGAYSERDARAAVRITWYGLEVAGATPTAAFASPAGQVYAQLLISSDLNGASSFEFRYGPLGSPGQAGYGSIAGFALGQDFYQFSGPYTDGTPTFFQFQDGRFFSDLNAAVPEPATWLQLILGFGLLGGALRGRRWRRARLSGPAFAS